MTLLSSTESSSLAGLLARYREVRTASELLCAPLSAEDACAQSMPDASPAKWHLAHTTWFFETFLLKAHLGSYAVFHDRFEYLFNSYYNAIGERHPRPQRGLLTRPSLEEVLEYRSHVDAGITEWLEQEPPPELLSILELGLHHEQQHQELLLTDVKHLLSCNALFPAYHDTPFARGDEPVTPSEWIEHAGGLVEVGHHGEGFCYDNEQPRHQTFVQPFRLASRLVTNGEFLEFINAGGYRDPQWWLSAGWDAVTRSGWDSPLYWTSESDSKWQTFTLAGLEPLRLDDPVSHVSFFEADAFARWKDARLPTEFEWEAICPTEIDSSGFVESRRGLVGGPSAACEAGEPSQMWGDVWEWTGSSYRPYPGYRPAEGAIGEYNGKFMCGQFVLRGGSCATPASHIRATYRNFFGPASRWQFTGFRLADDG